MSRQMAFQLTYFQIQEKFAILSKAPKPTGEGVTVGAWMDSFAKDEREKQMLMAAYSAVKGCLDKGRSVKDILKVIAWRCKDSDNLEFQTEFRRGF